MREIKFRAWDKELKELLPNVQNHINGSWAFGKMLENKRWVVEQYTGLKDKNGTDIYDGDIVQWDGVNYEIYWDQEYCQFMHRTSSCNQSDYFESDNSKAMEVVGNIHENPELL